jgi:hypothetical protein
MSGLLPKADIRQRIEHVCFVPNADTKFVPPGTGSFYLLDVRQLPSPAEVRFGGPVDLVRW